MWAQPESVTVPVGGSGTSTVYVAPWNGFTGVVNLQTQVYQQGAPSTSVTAALPSVNITGTSPATSTLTVNVPFPFTCFDWVSFMWDIATFDEDVYKLDHLF